jgi:hypothetical protein
MQGEQEGADMLLPQLEQLVHQVALGVEQAHLGQMAMLLLRVLRIQVEAVEDQLTLVP